MASVHLSGGICGIMPLRRVPLSDTLKRGRLGGELALRVAVLRPNFVS